jgi:hypothetical protein
VISVGLWRRLDVAGHDAARFVATGEGATLEGRAIFAHDDGPACIEYRVETNRGGRSVRGLVTGFLGANSVSHVIARESNGWTLDGASIPDLDDLHDIDFGFTPATNILHVRRAALRDGESADLDVVWFDLGEVTLTRLPQRYERIDKTRYRYHSPTGDYRAVLEMAPSGFVRSYPGLWLMES